MLKGSLVSKAGLCPRQGYVQGRAVSKAGLCPREGYDQGKGYVNRLYAVGQGWANFSPRGPHGTPGWSPEGRIKKTKFTR